MYLSNTEAQALPYEIGSSFVSVNKVGSSEVRVTSCGHRGLWFLGEIYS